LLVGAELNAELSKQRDRGKPVLDGG